MYRISNIEKQDILLKSGQKIFTTSDLALLWNILDRNTLLTTIKRYVQKGVLTRIYKGLYSTIPISQLNPYEVACAIGGPFSYISGETILSKEGIILQDIKKITLFGKKTKEITIGDTTYLCRYLNNKYLLNRAGIEDNRGYSIATKERAFADILHINPKFFTDNNTSININEINKLSEEVGYNDSTR